MTPVEEQIARMLGECADYSPDKITADTRVYHDAGLAGDDLYDFAVRLHEKLGVVFPCKLTVYAPGEGIGFGLRDFFPWWFKYRELKVRDLAAMADSTFGTVSAQGREPSLPRSAAELSR